MTAVRILPAARAELRRAVARFDAEASGTGDRLVDEVEQALRRIADFPEHGSPYLHGTRRVDLPRLPFSIVYRVIPGSALIVALAHHRRRPGYWLGRVALSPRFRRDDGAVMQRGTVQGPGLRRLLASRCRQFAPVAVGRLSSTVRRAAWVRSASPSLAMMCSARNVTVPGLTTSCRAIWPCANRERAQRSG